MAAPVRRTLFEVARGWRRFEGLRAGSLASRSLALAAASLGSGSPWRLLGALCLQRPPLVSKPLTPLQEEMAALLEQVGLKCGWWLQGAFGDRGTRAWVWSRLRHQLACLTLGKSPHLSALHLSAK